MSLQYEVEVRNAGLDAKFAAIGASPVLKIRSGAAPASCADADAGDVLATLNLPAVWMGSASGGAISKSGLWETLAADQSGTAGHFRIEDSGGDCRLQGTVGESAADMIVTTVDIIAGQSVLVTGFTIRDNNG